MTLPAHPQKRSASHRNGESARADFVPLLPRFQPPGKLLILAAVPLVLAAGALALKKPPAAGPLRTAFWYWHHPFQLRGEEQSQLRRLNAERLYVHAGTLSLQGGALKTTSRQEWKSEPEQALHAVIRVHPDANARFLQSAPEEIRALIRDLRLPRTVRGLQWDADIPTRMLPDYAAFLKRSRSALPPGTVLGATALPDWLSSPSYPALCRSLDEISPQFYGNHWPLPGKNPPPLWETRGLDRQLARAASGGIPVWAGFSAYGRCWVMDPQGRPLGVRHDLDPEPLLTDPAWEVRSAATSRASLGRDRQRAVEDTLQLSCRAHTSAGPITAPAGTSLWFQWPRPDALRAWSEALARSRPAEVTGVCYFRWPAPGEPLALSLGEPGTETPTVRVTRAGRTVTVTVLPGATGPSLDHPVTLTVHPAGGRLETLAEVEWRQEDLPISPLRADRALLHRPLLLPGRPWTACTVEDPTGEVTATLQWRAPDGSTREATHAETPRSVRLDTVGEFQAAAFLIGRKQKTRPAARQESRPPEAGIQIGVLSRASASKSTSAKEFAGGIASSAVPFASIRVHSRLTN